MSALDWLLLATVMALGIILLFTVRRRLDVPITLPPLREANPPLPDVLDALPVGVLVTDEHSAVLRCNPAAATLLGIEVSTAVGSSLIKSLRDYELDGLLRRVLAGGTAKEEISLAYNRRHLLASVSGLGEGVARCGLVVLQDVTQIRRVEQVRRDFVANVSHEFRTPLATAKLLVETALVAVGEEPEAARGFLNKANRELDSLTRLVTELLELARIEAGQTPLKLRPTPLAPLIEREVNRFEEQAARRGLHLELTAIDPHLVVMADESRAGEVVGNLVQNAIKFTAPGGHIRVAACRCPDQPCAEVSVADDGIGIPPEDLERVFERFYKVDRARSALLQASEQGGTGLGLAIARHLVGAQGGRIWAESELGQGATFRFTVPLA